MVALLVVACNSASGGGMMNGDDDGGDDDNGPPDPAPWSISVDMSATDRFVLDLAESWPVSGAAVADQGLDGVDVAESAASVDASGAFTHDVAVAPGLTVVPVLARDRAGNSRQAHRTLLSAVSYLPEGNRAPNAAGLQLDQAILGAMAGTLAGDTADIDVAGEIMMRDTLSVDDRCVTWPVYAEQDEPQVTLELDGTTIWLNVRIPNLYVYFEGSCQGLFSQIPIGGEMAMHVDVWTKITPKPSTECLVGFNHTAPIVQLPGFSFDVWGMGGPLQGWMVELASGGKAQEAHDQFVSEFKTQANTLLGGKLAGIKVFDKQETMTLLSQPVEVHLCLTSLAPVGGKLIARVGATASGAGSRAAPGAPQMGGALADPAAGELLLDADLVGQLLFSSWRAGGLSSKGVQQVEFSLLAILAPGLAGRYPDSQLVDVNIEGELPPVVTLSPLEGADLRVDIGDLMLDLVVGEERLFRLGARVTLDLDLVPDGGGLLPTVVAQTSEVHLLEELADAPDAALESAVQAKLGDSAAALLGGAKLKLPEIPGLGTPAAVTPDAGGRYLRVQMQ